MSRRTHRDQWPDRVARLRHDLAQIAIGSEDVQRRAEAVLDVLGRNFAFDTASLELRDPEERRRVQVATAGDAEPLRRYVSRPDADDQLEGFGFLRRRPPLLARELPAPLPEVAIWGEHLLPAGFRGGLAAGLFTTDGRHVGMLGLAAEDPSRPSRAEADAIGAVVDVIADVLDRTREIAGAARLVAGARAGAVLTRGGDTLPLPGMPGHPQLAPGSAAVAVAARELSTGIAYTTFLLAADVLLPTDVLLATDDVPTDEAPAGEVPVDGTDAAPLVRVTAVRCARPELDHLVGALLIGPPGDHRGLSALALRVLGLLADGVTQVPALAAALHTRCGPVLDALEAAHHVLGTDDPTALGVRAIATGLRIPPTAGPARTRPL